MGPGRPKQASRGRQGRIPAESGTAKTVQGHQRRGRQPRQSRAVSIPVRDAQESQRELQSSQTRPAESGTESSAQPRQTSGGNGGTKIGLNGHLRRRGWGTGRETG